MSDQPLVAVIDYGIGNLRSAQKALQRAGANAQLTDDPTVIGLAQGVALPGVGHFGTCVERLRASGLAEVTLEATEAAKPFLAICVGMQMLFEASEEAPGVAGLGVLAGEVRQLPQGLPRPQMQWNQLWFSERGLTESGLTEGGLTQRLPADDSAHSELAGHQNGIHTPTLLEGLPHGAWMYFVHSYAAETEDRFVSATCDYPTPITAMVQRDNLWGTQFHPEKSGRSGGKLVANFVEAVRAFAGDR